MEQTSLGVLKKHNLKQQNFKSKMEAGQLSEITLIAIESLSQGYLLSRSG